MGYFDDCELRAGAELPACQAFLDRRFPGTWSIEYLHAGRMEMAVDGGAAVVLDRPAAFWHLPERRYRYGAVDRRGWDHHWVLLAGPRARRLVEELQRVHPAGWAPVDDPAPFRARMRVLIDITRRGDPARRPEGVALVEELVARLVARPPAALAPVLALAERMRADPLRPWPLAREAAALGLSAVHLRRLFRRAVGMSPVAWCVASRLQVAAGALVDGAAVAAAGRLAGYRDPHQFSRMFRRRYGAAPRIWRAGLPLAGG